jgi:hypothetical protein
MQNVKASDHMAGSAKRAIDTALGDAATQRVAGTAPAVPSAEPVAPKK